MPVVFYKDSKGEHKTEGLSNSEFNFSYKNMYVSTDLIANEPMGISYEINPHPNDHDETAYVFARGNEAKNSGFAIGKFIFSEGFSPCIAVVAKLKDGNIAIYHAFGQFVDEIPGKTFIEEITRRGVVDLYVFGKKPDAPRPEEKLPPGTYEYQVLKYKIRAAVLALGFKSHNIPTTQVEIDNYTCIMADANTNKICLGNNKILRVESTESNTINKDVKHIAVEIDINKHLITTNDSVAFLNAAKEKNPTFPYGPAVDALLKNHKNTHSAEKQRINFTELSHSTEVNAYSDKLRQQAMNFPSNKYSAQPEKLSNLEKINLPNNKLIEEIVLIILNEIEHLKQKTSFCFFPAKNAENKAREIEQALARARKQFAIKPFANVAEFLEFKPANEISIKEALKIPRTPGAKPKIYERVVAAIEKQATKGPYIQISPKKQ